MQCENLICDNEATQIIQGDRIVNGEWKGSVERKVCASCCVRVAEVLRGQGYDTNIGTI